MKIKSLAQSKKRTFLYLLSTTHYRKISEQSTHSWRTLVHIRNDDLHRDLDVESVEDRISRFASTHQKRLEDQKNPEATHLVRIDDINRKLKRYRQ